VRRGRLVVKSRPIFCKYILPQIHRRVCAAAKQILNFKSLKSQIPNP
jgi:hypothetical protein